MENSIDKMNLKELDSFYKNVITNLPAKQQISYCEQLIDKAQLTLIRNSKLLSEIVEDELKKIIEAAQQEIKKLEKDIYHSNP